MTLCHFFETWKIIKNYAADFIINLKPVSIFLLHLFANARMPTEKRERHEINIKYHNYETYHFKFRIAQRRYGGI